jgi:hypothetical protein
LQHAPVPGALQDAAAVYAHLVTHHLGARKGTDGKYHYPDHPVPYRAQAHDSSISPNADPATSAPSASQTLDNKTCFSKLATLSGTKPSVDIVQRRESIETHRHDSRRESLEPIISGNDATPHPLTNSVHSTQPNSDQVAAAHRPRIILIGDSAGGNLVLALARWIRDEGVLPVPDGMLLLSPSCDPCTKLVITPRRNFR